MKKLTLSLVVIMLAFFTTVDAQQKQKDHEKKEQTEINWDELPEEVKSALSREYPEWDIVSAHRVEKTDNATGSKQDDKTPGDKKSDTQREANPTAGADKVYYKVVLTDGTTTQTVKLKSDGEIKRVKDKDKNKGM